MDEFKNENEEVENENEINIPNQLQFIYACVKKFNIVAAFGVHGGFLDILNVFGVPPNNTIRIITLNDLTDPQKQVVKWWKE